MEFMHDTPPAVRAAQALLDARRRHACPVLLGSDRGSARVLAVVEPGHIVRSALPLGALIEALFTERVGFEASVDTLRERWTAAPRHLESFDRLCWLFGERCAREFGLLPWLSTRQPYRLLAWPDFGEIGSDPHGVALCEALSREALSPQQAAQRLAWPEPLAMALFNAMALCGALVADERRKPGPQGGSLAWLHTVGSPAQHTVFGELWRRLKG